MTRVAVVTGAGRGIGAATVAAFAADGWSIVALDRCQRDPRLPYPLASEEELHAVVEAVGREQALPVVGDATDPRVMTDAVQMAEENFGGLDAMVAVAGVIAGGLPMWEVPREQEQAVIDVNLGGVLEAVRAAVPALLRRPEPRRGRVLAVASVASTRGLPYLAAYCASKAGVSGLVRALAVELRGTGITANAVAPGSTASLLLDESARLYGLESSEAFGSQQPLERLITPAEIAATLLWLASSHGDAITGVTIPVDGGLGL